jgi:hypothetical protein
MSPNKIYSLSRRDGQPALGPVSSEGSFFRVLFFAGRPSQLPGLASAANADQFAFRPLACSTHLFKTPAKYGGISLKVSPIPRFGSIRATVPCASTDSVSV